VRDLEHLKKEFAIRSERLNALDDKIEKSRAEIKELNDEYLEVKMHRIAMENITRCSRESLFRSMGYVKSFYGYPDMAKKCSKCKGDIE